MADDMKKLNTKPKLPVWRRPQPEPRQKPEQLTNPATSRLPMSRTGKWKPPLSKRDKRKSGKSPLTYDFGRYAESEFIRDISRKRLIIVGPAAYLKGMALGKYIDSFDYIVRVNHAIPIDYPEDYGTRTDILYHIMSRRNLRNTEKKLISKEEIQEWEDHGLKWLVSRHDFFSRRVREMSPRINGAFPWICIRAHFYTRMRQAVKRSPNTGLVAIAHMLTSQLTELQIIGFDFYRSGVYPGYGDFRRGEEAQSVNQHWHDTQSQVDYLRKVSTRDPRVKIDDTLNKILFGGEL